MSSTNVFTNCQSFALGKFAKLPFVYSTTQVDAPFHLIHCDLWDPSLVLSRLGYKYFALFIDHFTQFTWVYFLHTKYDLANIAQAFVAMIETQFGNIIKVFHSDSSGEFCVSNLNSFFSAKRHSNSTILSWHTKTKWDCGTKEPSCFGNCSNPFI